MTSGDTEGPPEIVGIVAGSEETALMIEMNVGASLLAELLDKDGKLLTSQVVQP